MRNVAAKPEVRNISSSKRGFHRSTKAMSWKDSTKRLYFYAKRERAVPKTFYVS